MNNAKAKGISLPISTKESVEVADFIRGKTVVLAKKILQNAIAQKVPIPFNVYTNGVGHRKGNLLAGKYAPNTCKNILMILESAEANAQSRGLNSSTLKIAEIIANKGPTTGKAGRQGGNAKRTHI